MALVAGLILIHRHHSDLLSVSLRVVLDTVFESVGYSRRSETAKAKQGTGARRLGALAGARMLASIHVAGGHLSRLGTDVVPKSYFLDWGFATLIISARSCKA
jgi:hypothetical protein